MKPLIIFGVGDNASVALFYFKHDSPREIVAFTVDKKYIQKPAFCGLPVVDFDQVASQYPPNQYDMFIAVGYSKMNQIRAQKCGEAKEKGYVLASYISSKAIISPGVPLGENSFILENNTVQPFAKIGDHVTLWSGNLIAHHSTIGDNSFIACQAVISGRVQVGENCFIGNNVTLRDHITIGKHCVIGAGALVVKDTKDYGVYIGHPAKLLNTSSSELKRI
jgi:sugar O-acyltransferase (sialic acid O-acetyltransferase NeuD family)